MSQTLPPPTLTDRVLFSQGKVRDLYDLGEGRLLAETTDRVSVFDVVLADVIPGKGQILNSLSQFFMKMAAGSLGLAHHLLEDTAAEAVIEETERVHPEVAGRLAVWRRVEPLLIEFIVRRHITGSLWKEYQARPDRRVHGHSYREGLTDGADLGSFYFTPSTKAGSGHDQNISFGQYRDLLGEQLEGPDYAAVKLELVAKSVVALLYGHCRGCGVIMADTKMEIGVDRTLIDELGTPDSSRFWSLKDWEEGRLVSMDKQFVRDYVLAEAAKLGLKQNTEEFDDFVATLRLPEVVIRQTQNRYQQIAQRLMA